MIIVIPSPYVRVLTQPFSVGFMCLLLKQMRQNYSCVIQNSESPEFFPIKFVVIVNTRVIVNILDINYLLTHRMALNSTYKLLILHIEFKTIT